MNRKLQREANSPSLRNLHEKQTKAMLDRFQKKIERDLEVAQVFREVIERVGR